MPTSNLLLLYGLSHVHPLEELKHISREGTQVPEKEFQELFEQQQQKVNVLE